MKTTLFTIVAIAALVVAGIGTASADQWYVVQHTSGFTTVSDYVPGYSWNVVSGPYASMDEAARAANIDPFNARMNKVMPTNPIRSFD